MTGQWSTWLSLRWNCHYVGCVEGWFVGLGIGVGRQPGGGGGGQTAIKAVGIQGGTVVTQGVLKDALRGECVGESVLGGVTDTARINSPLERPLVAN